MKKFLIIGLAALSIAGSVYAGSCKSCGGCSGKKEKTEAPADGEVAEETAAPEAAK